MKGRGAAIFFGLSNSIPSLFFVFTEIFPLKSISTLLIFTAFYTYPITQLFFENCVQVSRRLLRQVLESASLRLAVHPATDKTRQEVYSN